MDPSSGQPGQAPHLPPAAATQRPAPGVTPGSILTPPWYPAHPATSSSATQPLRPPGTAPPPSSAQSTSPRATAFRPPPSHLPAKPAATSVPSIPRTSAGTYAVPMALTEAPAAATEDDSEDEVFKAYVDALSAMDPQSRAAISVRPPPSNPPGQSVPMQRRLSSQPIELLDVGSENEELRRVAKVQAPALVRVDGTGRVTPAPDTAGEKKKMAPVRNRQFQAAVQAASNARPGNGSTQQPHGTTPRDNSNPPSAPKSTPSTQPSAQAAKPALTTQSAVQPSKASPSTSTISSSSHVSSATAAAAAAAAAWNARFGPTIDERLFSPTPSRSPVATSSAPVSSSAPTPSSAPAPPSVPPIPSAPVSSSAPATVSAPVKEISLDLVAARKDVDGDSTSSGESGDEDGVNALLGGDAAKGDAEKKGAEKGKSGGTSSSGVAKGGDAPVASGASTSTPVVNGQTPVVNAQTPAQGKDTTSNPVASSTTSSAPPPPNAPPSEPTNETPLPSAQQVATTPSVPISASSQPKKGPWKYHALVEEELVDGVWRRVGEVEGMHVDVSPAPRSASLAPSVPKEQEESPAHGSASQRSTGWYTRGGQKHLRHLKGTLHRLASQCAEIARDPDQAERELVAVWGPDFRQELETETKHHQLLLRLAGHAISTGCTFQQIKDALFQARDARLAGRRKEPGSSARVLGLNYADINLVLRDLSRGGGLGSSFKDESAVNGVAETSPRELSATPRVTSSRRTVASQKPQDDDAEMSEREPRSLRPVKRSRYIESDSGSISDDDKPLYRRRKRARYDEDPSSPRRSERRRAVQLETEQRQPEQQHPKRTPMDQLMVTSFLNFSQSAPDALGAGQEMNLRFGRDSTGAYYFTHTVTTEQPPISVDRDGRATSIRSGYRLSPLTLGRLDDMLEISLAVPPPAASVPATASATSPLVNGTQAVASSPAPSSANPTVTQNPPVPSLAVPEITPSFTATTSATYPAVPAPVASPNVVDTPKSAQPTASETANSRNVVPPRPTPLTKTAGPSAPALTATTNGSGAMDVDAPHSANGISHASSSASKSLAVDSASRPLVAYPEASASFLVSGEMVNKERPPMVPPKWPSPSGGDDL